ncbi:hypothetical protein GL4_2188 [Methyloceanibacter caenitepidi]|uniref:Uncharacterized protein n=1 Tax=Methyloceanibacter caenitepidi TaxID=1384459 RepID=A0A0A8K4A8_9HYPH|nr:hypothetical protein GL4_2188 [Methyloceanibacter caenitepidi]
MPTAAPAHHPGRYPVNLCATRLGGGFASDFKDSVAVGARDCLAMVNNLMRSAWSGYNGLILGHI